jgi:hypothetical protein
MSKVSRMVSWFFYGVVGWDFLWVMLSCKPSASWGMEQGSRSLPLVALREMRLRAGSRAKEVVGFEREDALVGKIEVGDSERVAGGAADRGGGRDRRLNFYWSLRRIMSDVRVAFSNHDV